MGGAARLRARVLALVSGALRESGRDQVTLAALLGVKKSAVSALLHGNGNVRINSLAEYMGVLGYEVDMIAVPIGEIEAARNDRRGPRHVALTMADADRMHDEQSKVVAVHVNEFGWNIIRRVDSVGLGGSTRHPSMDLARVNVLKDNYTRKLEASHS